MKKRRPALPAKLKAREPAANRPFAMLRNALAPRPKREPAAPRGAAPAPAEPVDDEDRALFRRETAGIRPLRDRNRHHIEAPKPAPMPLNRGVREEPSSIDAPRDSALGEASLFTDAMRGVRRMAPANRVELDAPVDATRSAPSVAPASAAPSAPGSGASDEVLLDWAYCGVAPLRSADRVEIDAPRPPPLPVQRQRDERSVLKEAIENPLDSDDRLDVGDEAVFLRPGLPRRVLSDLRRGRWVRQRELDLHGMTREHAREALGGFLARCLADRIRCVRLIHGKGLGSPGGVGLLKQLSRAWLARREEILAFCEARPHEGGSGALLILLRAGSATGHESG